MLKKLINTIFIFIVVFLPESLMSAEWEFNQNCKKAYSLTLNLQFSEANAQILNPSNSSELTACQALIHNYQDFLSIFILEDEQLFKQKERNRKTHLRILEDLPDNEPFKRWSLAVVNLQWAFSRLKFKEYFTAAFEIRKAYFLLQENNELFPEFAPNLIGSGLLNAILGTVPPDYKWVLNMASMEGSIHEGRRQLWQLAEKAKTDKNLSIWLPETLFYLSFIEINLNKDPKATQRVLEELENFENKSALLVYAEANLLMRNGKNEQAKNLLATRHSLKTDIPFYYLDYLYAETLSRSLDSIAIPYYKKYETNFSGLNYKADALRKIAWMALINGDTSLFLSRMKHVLNYKSVQVDADKQAVEEAKNQLIYHPELLKVRLLFDGGYYKRALNVLNEIDEFALLQKDAIEYYYRKGRIADETSNTSDAAHYYGLTIKTGYDLPYYYAANAALKLGELYEQSGDIEQAGFYFQKCLEMKPADYRVSIHQKAQAGLNRINKK